MGAECCKASGNTGTMNVYLEFTGDLDLKESVSQATTLLKKARTIKYNYEKCQETCESLTTVPLRDPLSVLQNIQVLLWVLSASHKGKIQQAGFSITACSPFIKVNSKYVSQEVQHLIEGLRSYFDIITTETQTIKQIAEDLYNLKSELNKWRQKRGAQSEREESMATNYKKLIEELKDIEKLEETLREANEKVSWIIERTQQLVPTVDEVGFQANREGLHSVLDIVQRFRICLDSGKDRKKWLIRVSGQFSEELIQGDCSLEKSQIDKGSKENIGNEKDKVNLKISLESKVTFGPSEIKDGTKRYIFQKLPVDTDKVQGSAKLKLSDQNVKKGSMVIKGKTDILGNTREYIPLGPKKNPFLVDFSDISIDVPKMVSEANVNSMVNIVTPRVREMIYSLDKTRGTSLNENIDDGEELSISVIQNSLKKNMNKIKE